VSHDACVFTPAPSLDSRPAKCWQRTLAGNTRSGQDLRVDPTASHATRSAGWTWLAGLGWLDLAGWTWVSPVACGTRPYLHRQRLRIRCVACRVFSPIGDPG
jgi:hypothetical protein